MSKIFFSYSRKDSNFVDELIGKLEARGVDVWVDRGDILAGVATWRQQIVEAIMECQVFVIVLSPNSIASDNVTKELTLAEQHVKRVLPLVIEAVTIPPSLDYQLAGLHYQTFAEGRYEDNFERLARSLGALGVTMNPMVEIVPKEVPSPIQPKTESQITDQPKDFERSIPTVSGSDVPPEIQPTQTDGLQGTEAKAPDNTETIPPGDPDPSTMVAAGTAAIVEDQKTKTEILPPAETIPPEITETVIDSPAPRQQAIPGPTSPISIQSQSPVSANPLEKVPIWLWAGGGFVVLIGIIFVSMSIFGGRTRGPDPTATEEIAVLKPTEITEPMATNEIVQVLPSETSAPTPIDVPTSTSLPIRITDKTGGEMFLIKAGSFQMGTSRTDALKECQRVNPSLNCEGFYFGDEEPVRSVSLDYDYYIDQYEVTNELYDVCVTAGVCAPPWNFDIVAGVSYFRNEKYSQYPVVNVTWDAANDYCEWRGGRLPTEAEWEKAARGGDDARLYPWGNFLSETIVNFCDINCSNSWANKAFNDGYEFTAPGGAFSSSASFYGVEDMAGNVSEWVADFYGPYPGGEAETDSENFGKERVRRGGSWYSLGSDTRVSRRDKNLPSPQIEDPNSELGKIGFRCVLDVP